MVRRKKSEASLVNKTSLRVRFSEVDSMQIVWHGEYVRYFEDGREAFGREFAGLGYMDIYASGYTAPIVELHLQYRKPLKVNDTAVVETRYIATEAAKVCFEYTIRSATDGEVVAEGSSTQVFLDSRGELQLRTGSSRVRRVKNTPAVSSSTAISEMPMPPPTGRVNRSPQSRLYTVSIKWDILRSLLLCDYFIIIQHFRFVNQKIPAQGK